jgi:predicted TIM-barrel fold metal-dependent hydrolase
MLRPSEVTVKEKLPDKIIDFHVHLFPDNVFDALWRTFDKLYGSKPLYQYYCEQCIEYLTDQGVQFIVYSNYAHKKGIAEWLNTWNKSILNKYENLYCFAAYHPDDENALSYAEEILSHERVVGIKLHYMVQQIYPDDERLFPLYETVIRRKKRLLLHVGTGPVGNEFVGYKYFSKLLKRFPDLPANVAHMGGLEYGEFVQLLDVYPNLYFDTSYTFWPQTPWCFNLDAAILEHYRDKILYGSDFPNVFLPREDEINYLLKLNLSRDFYQKVFWANGIKLLTAKPAIAL